MMQHARAECSGNRLRCHVRSERLNDAARACRVQRDKPLLFNRRNRVSMMQHARAECSSSKSKYACQTAPVSMMQHARAECSFNAAFGYSEGKGLNDAARACRVQLGDSAGSCGRMESQ